MGEATNTVGRLFPDWEAAHADDPKPLPERIRVMHRMHGTTAGKTCGNCAHLRHQGMTAGRYLKCSLSVVRRGAATDWRASWLACGKFEQRKGVDEVA